MITKIRLATIAMAAVLTGLTLASAIATRADVVKGAERQWSLNHITTRSEAEALQPGDSIAMVCAKCKSVTVENVTTEKGHIKVMTVGEKHLCPGCNSTIEVKGTGKRAKDEVKHVCQKCGDQSVFCCATKAGEGPTKGMHK